MSRTVSSNERKRIFISISSLSNKERVFKRCEASLKHYFPLSLKGGGDKGGEVDIYKKRGGMGSKKIICKVLAGQV